jgi:coenzyme F420-dependent glucose-6-phosphate dehydrogenase
MNEYPTTRLWPDYYKCQDMMRKAIELMRLLWSGDEVTFNGNIIGRGKPDFTRCSGGASFAGYYGDGMVTVSSTPEVMKSIISNFEAGARESGKDPEKMPKQVEIMVAYTDDADAAVEIFKQYRAGTMIFATHLQNIYTPEMVAVNGAIVGDDVIKNRLCISSNSEVHAKFAQRFIDAGFNRLYFHSAGPDQYEFIEGYWRDMLPTIRKGNRPRAAVTL